ncbi:MAG: fumarylacetoacetate hydrolase family protein, partial [Acidimicrobiales bacterium]
MRLVTFDGGRVGKIIDDRIVEFRCDSMRQYFELSGEVDETGESFALSKVTLDAPIVPKKFFHTSGNFREHGEDLERVNWSHPVNKGIVFFQNVDAIVGPGQPVIYPEHLTRELDYELELGIVIGKPGKFFSTEEARQHIAGFVIFNDITARVIQRREIKSGVFSFC